MSSVHKIKFFKRIAMLLSIIWTIVVYAFYTYQINNENNHIYDATIEKSKISVRQAEQLIYWASKKKVEAKKQGLDLGNLYHFSLKELITNITHSENSTLKIMSNYLKDDLLDVNDKIKKSIDKAQNSKRYAYTQYEKNGNSYLYYIKPLLADRLCLSCHIHADDKVGDVLGNVNLSMKIETFKENNSKAYWFLIYTYIFTWAIGLTIIWVIRYKSRKYFDEKMKNYEDGIYSLVDMMERRDHYTAGHSKRVAHYSSLIAKKMGFNADDVNLIYRAGMLHDIGKIEVSDAVLLKPDTLNKDEYELIKTHSKVGYELLSRHPFYELASIVLSHHECYDGSGYPYGLKGNQIPTLSQIISVADVYDAVTTHRAYRRSMSKEEGIKILEDGIGNKFNPDIIAIAKDIFIELPLDEEVNYSSKEMIKDMKFSYYFRDHLTGFYNINYLKFLLKHRDNYNMICANHLNFINFTAYNEKHGWKKGDKFLQDASLLIMEKYEDCVLVRVFGDNFIILNFDKHVDMDVSIFDDITSESNMKTELKHINVLEEGVDSFDKLEDLLHTIS